ncbi:tetratricopeptide repeat-containing diguanylate cyclase [Clostridium ihumii]|uniref:tetratricopeptide repeat-containing diguanylate cyclase n=1 Tax=Clostridium ihumii TaxID=1470356 RepID=UPI00058D1374|nr:GGDEF domain-containing protein [Clostridium ihumii]
MKKNLIYFTTLIIMLFLFIIPIEIDDDKNMNSLIKEVSESYFNKTIIDKKTIEEKRNIIKNYPNSSTKHFLNGYFDYISYDFNSALKNFKLACTNINNTTSYFVKIYSNKFLADCFIRNEKYNEAVYYIEEGFGYINESNPHYNEEDIWEVLKTILYIPEGREKVIKILERGISHENISDEYRFYIIRKLEMLYVANSNYGKAIEYGLEIVTLSEKLDKQYFKAKAIVDLSLVFRKLGGYDQAKLPLKESLEIDIDDDYENALAKTYGLINLSELHIITKHYDAALETALRISDYTKYLSEDEANNVEALKNIIESQVYSYKGELEKAENSLKEAELLMKCESKKLYLDQDITLIKAYGDLLYNKKDYKDSISKYEYALKLAKERNNRELKKIITEKLAELYSKIGDKDTSNFYKDELINLSYEEQEVIHKDYSIYAVEKQKYQEAMAKNYKHESVEQKNWIITLILLLILEELYNNDRRRIRRLEEEKDKDFLTMLYNRRYLDEYENKVYNYIDDYEFSIIMLDIDYFKLYNDNYGHVKGDKVIKEVSNAIREVFRKDDICVRYGGEEFCIILKETPKEVALERVKRLRNSIKRKRIAHRHSKVTNIITVSIGVYTKGKYKKESLKNVVNKADKALYVAKESGRDKVVHFDECMK